MAVSVSEANAQQHQQLQLFSAGSEVEVRSDEEGFEGVWFRATIVTSPTKRKRALVEYKYLVTDDGSHQLKEYVDSAHIRPPPPLLSDRKLEVGDVVDADYRDGWWTGDIKEVLDLDNNSKFKVVFANPPDLIEFQRQRLRLHQDWVGGKWVRPNNSHQEVLAASDSSQDLEHVLHAQNNSNHFQVDTQLGTPGAVEDNPGPTDSGKNCIEQPSYPQSIKEKEMLACNGSPTDVTPLKKLKDDKTAEDTSSDAAGQNKEMIHELAALSRGVRGTRCTKKSVAGHLRFQTESFLGEKVKTKKEKEKVDSQCLHPSTNKGRRTKPQGGSRLIQEIGYICALPSQRREKETGKEENASGNSAGRIVQNGAANKEAELPIPALSKAMGKEGTLPPKSCQLPNKDLGMKDQKKNESVPAHEKNMGGNTLNNVTHQSQKKEPKQQPDVGSSNKRKRGRPSKVVIASPQTAGGVKEKKGPENVADHPNVGKDQKLEEVAAHVLEGIDSTDPDPQDVSRRKTAEYSGTSCLTNEAARVWVGASDNTDDDDRPISMWFGGMQCPASVGESITSADRNTDQHRDRRALVEVARESSAVDAASGSGTDKKRGFPFAKTSPVWKTINALDVFRMLPQNPHFRPLGTCKEDYREGLAIGNMITFSSVAEKISRLHFEDPRNVFESILESLLDLEKYGFSVAVLRGRVNGLLSIKDRQGRFEVESKDSECKIGEHSHEKTKLAEEADRIAKKIIELQEKQALMKAEMEAKELEISRLQLHVGAIKEGMQTTRSDFQKLASAPFK